MSITVTGRKMPVTDALREYAEEKIGNSMKVMDIDPLVAEIVLFVEKNPANPRPAVCEVTLRTKGHIIRVEEHEEDMYAAIDVAAAKVVRQLRKYKTKVVDRKLRAADEKRVIVVTGEDRFAARAEELAAEYRITARESEIMLQLARGRSAAFIADELVCSPATVRTHMKNIYAKLGVHSKQELIDLFAD